jgi:hypothetical protein
MRILLLIVSIFLSVCCRAQTGAGKTLVIKVRAPKASCSVFTDGDFFWLEKNNVIRVVTRGITEPVQVVVTGGRIVAQDGERYSLFFTQLNDVVVSVYRQGTSRRESLYTRKFEVRGPTLWFCGIKTDSSSYGLKLRGDNLYAWSDCFKQPLRVSSFDMVFMQDTNNRRAKKEKPEFFHSDTCMLTKAMTDKVLGYQPKYNFIYFHNIVCVVPDGTKRILDPIRLHAVNDSIDVNTVKMRYAVYTKTD